MDIVTSFLVAIGLAMDACAVSIGIGTGNQARGLRAAFRLAFHFGLFQMGMTLIGWTVGATIADLINHFDHWIALGLLSYVGLRMIRSGLRPDQDSYLKDPSRGSVLVMLSVATSLDALAVGLSMALLKQPVWVPAIIIGIVALIFSAIGFRAGRKLGQRFGKRIEILGGLILLEIGVRILVTHLT